MAYKVVVEHDGCTHWQVDHPDAHGSLNACKAFVGAHLPPRGCEFGIVNLDTRRQVSFLAELAPRRYRLQMQDLAPLTE